MKVFQGTTSSPLLLFCISVICLIVSVEASSDISTGICAEVTWQAGEFMGSEVISTSISASTASSSKSISSSHPVPLITFSSLITMGPVVAGDLVCRVTGSTEMLKINCCTCAVLAHRWRITLEEFFMLNPGLEADCSNIQADTEYCVRGYIEPLRAFDGLCGPPHKNATCLGTDLQCCNGKTFTCGDTAEDCAPGNCWEGACYGDSIYTTTGHCGRQHGYRQCAGIWGDCCNAEGKCGTGPDYCGFGNCQLGKCTVPDASTAGLCGGSNGVRCTGEYGRCCNKNGRCGRLPSDCGVGCQKRFGTCSLILPGLPTCSSSTMGSSSRELLQRL